MTTPRRRIVIAGAAGRDFHNFNTFFRDNEDYRVVAFTATQIPDIDTDLDGAEQVGAETGEHVIEAVAQHDDHRIATLYTKPL